MATATSLTGAAGEYFVMSALLRRGYIAALAPDGVPNLDIVVTSLDGGKQATLQVKSRLDKGADGGWHMSQKHESIVQDRLFYSFVDFGKDYSEQPKCWIVPSVRVAEVVKVSHEMWLRNLGKNGKIRKDSKMRRFVPDYSNYAKPEMTAYPLGWLDR